MICRHMAAAIGCVLIAVSTAQAGVEVLAPRLSVSEEYTDNLFLTDTEKQEEFSTIISPGFDYSATTQKGRMDFSYTAGYAIYKESDEDSFLRHNATLSMNTNPAKHTRASFQNFFLWTDQPAQKADFSLLGYVVVEDQLLPVLDTTIRNGLNEYMTNTATANLTHQFGENNSINFRGLFGLRKEIDSEYGNDNQQYTPAIDLTYWMTPQFGFDMSAIYTRGVFPNSDDFNDWQGLITLRRKVTRHLEIFSGYDQIMRRYDGDTGIDYDNYSGSAGITYRSDNNLSLTLGVGYFSQDLIEGEDQDGFFFNGSVDKAWTTPRGTARLVGAAGLDRNEFGTENLGLERFYSLGATAGYRLTRHFQATFNATARISDFLNTETARTDYRVNAGCGLQYIPKPWLSISASYAHTLLRGREDSDYDENSAILTVSFTPQGLRFN